MIDLKNVFLKEAKDVGYPQDFVDRRFDIPDIIKESPKYLRWYEKLLDAVQQGSIRNTDYKDITSQLAYAVDKDFRDNINWRSLRDEEDAKYNPEFYQDLYYGQPNGLHGVLSFKKKVDKAQRELGNCEEFKNIQRKVEQWYPIAAASTYMKNKIVKRGDSGYADVKTKVDLDDEISGFLWNMKRFGKGYVVGGSTASCSKGAMSVVKAAYENGITNIDDILGRVYSHLPEERNRSVAESFIRPAYKKHLAQSGAGTMMDRDQMKKIIDEFDSTYEDLVLKISGVYRANFEKDWKNWMDWKADHENEDEYLSRNGKVDVLLLFYRMIDPKYPIGTFKKDSDNDILQRRIKSVANSRNLFKYIVYDDTEDARKKMESDLAYIIKMEKGKLHQNIINKLGDLNIKSVEKNYVDLGPKGFEGSFTLHLEDGTTRIFSTQAFFAGGWNIQKLHVRYKSDLK